MKIRATYSLDLLRVSQLIAATAAFALAVAATAGDTIHVPADYETIQQAIDAAAGGDEIIVEPGIYNEVIDFLGKSIHLRSSEGRDVTTISAATLEQPVSVVTFIMGEGRDSILDGFTITGGHGTDMPGGTWGGGVYITKSSPTIRNCRISQNSAKWGAGLAAHVNAAPLIEDCEITGNQVESIGAGGGARISTDSPAHFVNVLFEDNRADLGGGFVTTATNQVGGVLFEGCIFKNNRGADGGGVNMNTNSLAIFIDCLFEGNQPCDTCGITTGGGAAYILSPINDFEAGSAQFLNCEFLSNTGSAGIGNGGSLEVTNCSFIGNNGGGISSGTPSSTATITDSLFQGNSVRGGIIASGQTTITGCTFTGNFSNVGSGGGAIRYSGFGGSLLLVDSVLDGNTATAGPGGGLRVSGPATIQNTTFRNNSAPIGGGLHIGGSTVIDGCTIENNVATAASSGGGGVAKAGVGLATITNTLITGNTANGAGAGIRHEAGTLTVIGSTIAGNIANVGGAAYKDGTSGELQFESTLFCENDPDHIDGAWTDLGGNSFHDECPPCAPADLNCDNSVGVADLLILLAKWGKCDDCGLGNCAADLNDDCTVGVADLLILLANWG